MSRYIDADKTLKAITSQFDDCVCIADVIYVFDNQPTADVRENVSGEWIDRSVRKRYANGHDTYEVFVECSNCECLTDIKSDFCPDCGADMRGGYSPKDC